MSAPSERSRGISAVHQLGTDDSEVVDVIQIDDGWRAFVTSPVSSCEYPDESSFVAVLDFRPSVQRAPEERAPIDLGPGEATSVAAGPGGSFALVTRKDPDRPASDPGAVLVLRGGAVTASIPCGPGPDSIALTPQGDLAVVACEAEAPDPEDCPEEEGRPDRPGSIGIIALQGSEHSWGSTVEIGGDLLAARIAATAGGFSVDPRDVEPEYAAVSPDGKTALVTLQEQSAVAVLDLEAARHSRVSPLEAGSQVLEHVVLLPQGEEDKKGIRRGAHPDGVAFGPDGSLAITANEAHGKVRHLQGISVIDLRGGPGRARVAGTYSIFELDPTLRDTTDARRAGAARRGKETRKAKRLPRLDPEGLAIGRSGEKTLAAVAIERNAAPEKAGSVLLLDVTRVLEGEAPVKVARRVVGSRPGARPETLDFTDDGRWLLVASERDGGTLTLIGVAGLILEAGAGAERGSRVSRP